MIKAGEALILTEQEARIQGKVRSYNVEDS